MSQCVPNWDLDDAVRSRSRLHLRPHPSTSNSSDPDVPMLDYEMAELTWENGQLSMHGLGRSKPNLASSNKGLKYAWERPRAAAGTLESIVNLATQKPPPPLVRCFGTRPQPPGAKGTMDALVPCEEERRGPDLISTRGAGCSTRVDSCSGAAAATCEPTRDGDGDEGSVLKKPRSAPRVPAAAREASVSVSTMGADSWHVPTVDTCEKELMGGFGLTSTSFCSQGNTLSSSGHPATTNNDDHDSVCHSRPQRETRKDEEKKRIAKSSSSTRRSRAAAIHNQSERKRRDKINQKMKMLQKLVPNSNKGGAIHCVARANISHCFTGKLLVGEIYAISKFTVAPPKPTYQLRNGNPFVIQLEGSTIVRRLDCPPEGFDRHPLQLVPLQDIIFNDSKFLIDVVGCPINIGPVRTTPSGAQLLEFHLMNERGNMIKISMWGSMGEDLIQRNKRAKTPFIVVLASMNVRHWNGDIYLSTTSATTLYDTEDIPAIKQLQLQMSTAGLPTTLPPLPTITARQGTLSALLLLGREQKAFPKKDSITFHIEAKITRVLPENSWNYLSCGERNCRKGLTPIGGQFYCASCFKTAEFPLVRYRLNFEVSDHTATIPVTVFDDLAETLLKKKAATLLKEVADNPEECVLPQEIKKLANTYHVFEVKTHTYFATSNDSEKFTVSRIVSSRPMLKEKAGGSGLPTTQLRVDVEEQVKGDHVVDVQGSEKTDTHDGANEVVPNVKTPNTTTSKKRKAVVLSSDDESGGDNEFVASEEHATTG